MYRRMIGFFAAALIGLSPAHAINGGKNAPADIAAQTVQIISTRGSICSATVIARDLVLTAGHCVQPRANYAISISEGWGGSREVPVARIVLHPNYDPHQFETRKPSPDMAILKMAEPLPSRFHPARIANDRALPKPGDTFTLAGYGFSVDGDPDTIGKVRSITLPAIGTTGGIMVRVSAGGGSSAGACTGDSGGPAFRGEALAAVIGWINTPEGRNCGSVTGATLVGLQHDWIVTTARALGAAIRE
ncbi:MAG TPA: S1 family peptidase [Xanthobacteraceae bacterium]|nr:S1 family peptidase [Xanthobacteraceae bacterium]